MRLDNIAWVFAMCQSFNPQEKKNKPLNSSHWCDSNLLLLVLMPKICAGSHVERKLMGLEIWKGLSNWIAYFTGGGVKEASKIWRPEENE